ncbi:hypothetical protein RF11_02342 [Thelohanellus kitauei]|uniref:MD-2-related lipid-recognition domain-containing protein n=1 Tax=Thelohanellus kitauei TaxID=669202 RepID=A0A0C2NAF1_THEKT|nr:hypothetical protein RF11_02342 [Thelohanellus kitauei]
MHCFEIKQTSPRPSTYEGLSSGILSIPAAYHSEYYTNFVLLTGAIRDDYALYEDQVPEIKLTFIPHTNSKTATMKFYCRKPAKSRHETIILEKNKCGKYFMTCPLEGKKEYTADAVFFIDGSVGDITAIIVDDNNKNLSCIKFLSCKRGEKPYFP